MNCPNCTHQDARRVALLDGRHVCSWCEDYRHECEARAILALPTLRQRRAYLEGKPDSWGNMKGGILQRRGADEVKRLKATMMQLWMAERAGAVQFPGA